MSYDPPPPVLPSQSWPLPSSSLATIASTLPMPDPRLIAHYRTLLEAFANAPERDIIPHLRALADVDPSIQGLLCASRMSYLSWASVQSIRRELSGTTFWSNNTYCIADRIRRIEQLSSSTVIVVETVLADLNPGLQWVYLNNARNRMSFNQLRQYMMEFPGNLADRYPDPPPANHAPAPPPPAYDNDDADDADMPPLEDVPQPPTHIDPALIQQPSNPIEMLAEAALRMVEESANEAPAEPVYQAHAGLSGNPEPRTFLIPGVSSSSSSPPSALSNSDINRPLQRRRRLRQTAVPSPSTRARLREIRQAQRLAEGLRPLPEAQAGPSYLRSPVDDRSASTGSNKENDNPET